MICHANLDAGNVKMSLTSFYVNLEKKRKGWGGMGGQKITKKTTTKKKTLTITTTKIKPTKLKEPSPSLSLLLTHSSFLSIDHEDPC